MSGIGYTYQNLLTLIGSKSGTNRSPVSLTASYQTEAVGVPTKSFTTGTMAKVQYSILYTTGASEAGTSLDLKVETSPDGTNWYQLLNASASSGTSTIYQREFVFSAGAGGTAYEFSLPLDIQDKYMKVSVKESGVTTNFGTIFVEVVTSGAE